MTYRARITVRLGAYYWRVLSIATVIAVGLLCILATGGDGGGGCTTDPPRLSVVITVVDSLGEPLPGATVTYRVDGGEEMQALCFPPEGDCTTFSAGIDETGVFTILVTKPGFQPAQASVTVTWDVCHVITQNLEITLFPQ